jgi:hypothetical protein
VHQILTRELRLQKKENRTGSRKELKGGGEKSCYRNNGEGQFEGLPFKKNTHPTTLEEKP